MRKILYLFFLLLFFNLQAQEPQKPSSSEIFKKIQKLNFLGSALYLAAHPDDENTRLISYLSNELNARTAYLSLTRGDGGQNLIGPELRELLGVIRTQELLAARDIDGGEQLFTRANDFGYSKNPSETLNIWNEEEIMKDVVRAIRDFRPDVVINRFKVESAGETHGQHTASAILGKKAFQLAGEKLAFPELADELGTWQPKKLFFNTSPWFYDSQEAFEAADKSNFLEFDTGVYFPIQGMSNTEIASLSRSQHQSQGFGSTGARGKAIEYIELIAGQHPENADSLFAGINTTWSRIKGGKEIGNILSKVEKDYNFRNPSTSIPGLVKAYKLIQNLEDEHWKNIKSVEIKEIIAASAGLFLEATATERFATPGEEVFLELEAINRSPVKIGLAEVSIHPVGKNIPLKKPLLNNNSWRQSASFKVPENADFGSPYWLEEKGSLGMYKVEDPSLIGLPETPKQYKAEFLVEINGTTIPFTREIVYKTNDPVKGEVYWPFEIVPTISVKTQNEVVIFPDQEPKEISVIVTSFKDSLSGELHSGTLNGWKIVPETATFGPLRKGEEKKFAFTITPPAGQEMLIFRPTVVVNGKKYSKAVIQLDYEHIPLQTLVLANESKFVKLDIQKRGKLIGYIEGAGDVVPQALEQIGYEVETLAPENISAKSLQKYDAVVIGIRGFNVVDALQHKQQALFEYVKSGGNVIVQYNTSRSLVTEQLAPYPLELSHDRVTNENAEVRFLAEEHLVLNFPNKITESDFEGWVQERGLYFPNKWGSEFTPILSMNDPGESPKNGSLLIAPYGKGYYIYTGLSFFREFPAGVPGAFRLFANLISLGKDETTLSTSQNSSN